MLGEGWPLRKPDPQAERGQGWGCSSPLPSDPASGLCFLGAFAHASFSDPCTSTSPRGPLPLPLTRPPPSLSRALGVPGPTLQPDSLD